MFLMLYYTHSRSEYPLPKTRNGQGAFDPKYHTRKADFRSSQGYAEWGLGGTKADRLGKRGVAGEDHREWRPVGHATGIMNMLAWVALYDSLCPDSFWPTPDSPYFVDANGLAILYPAALSFLRTLLARVPGMTMETAMAYGLHGLRVLGYNCHKAANGEDVAALQGGWGSSCHRRYSREVLATILSFAQKGALYASRQALPPMPLDDLAPRVRDPSVFLDTPPEAAATSTAITLTNAATTPRADLPDSVTVERRESCGRTYYLYTHMGTRYRSLRALRRALAE
mmetsp:Transcript_19378/g.32393  ORF Transcript_19378/g.32393 Transcript_19378/m.32393 type:complete len:284 (+) Transcript_19378:63-914(+)